MRGSRIALGILLLYAPAEASTARISSGQDLVDACKVLSDFALNPQGPTPRQGLYCRQFLAGYFTSLRYTNGMTANDDVQGAPIYSDSCIMLNGPRSFDQLAREIVHHGEWHPELLPKPATELVGVTFGGRPPC
ncbi:MAG: hypothetical protein V4441_08795 [Pseudomonadota bacterium]